MIPRLWFVTDGERGTRGRPLRDVIEAAAAGGVEACVIREFQWESLQLAELIQALQPARERGLKLLLSRRLDLVRSLAVDGVQLAADAVPIRDARAWLGDGVWIGYSAHSAEEAQKAAEDGATYVTLSPIYSTDSKPGLPGRGLRWLADATRELPIPALALGGVTPDRTEGILRSGAWGLAAVSALGGAPEIERAAQAFCAAIEENTRPCA